MQDCLPRHSPHAGAEEEREEEVAAETRCNGLTTTRIPHPPV